MPVRTEVGRYPSSHPRFHVFVESEFQAGCHQGKFGHRPETPAKEIGSGQKPGPISLLGSQDPVLRQGFCAAKYRSRGFGRTRTRAGASTGHAAAAERSDPAADCIIDIIMLWYVNVDAGSVRDFECQY